MRPHKMLLEFVRPGARLHACHGGCVRVRWSLLALHAALLVGCKDEGKPFLGLKDLCPRVAADICSARERCACEAVDGNCAKDERARCEEQRAIFAVDDDLDYYSVHAARVVQEQAAALELCDPPFPLGRFFEHVRAEGDACERDAQCESGSCDPDAQICEAPEMVELCPAP